MKATIICSGGLDSTVLLYDLVDRKYNVDVITFKPNTRLGFLEETIKKLKLNLVTFDMPQNIDNLNMTMLSIAAGYNEKKRTRWLIYAAQISDLSSHWDYRPGFIDSMNATLDLNDIFPVKILMPYINTTKAGIVKIGLRLKVPFQDTMSCLQPFMKACGICEACKERLAAFKANNAIDPIQYEVKDADKATDKQGN